jgi:hypothetical protein
MLVGYLDRPSAARVGRQERDVTVGSESTAEVAYHSTGVPLGKACVVELRGDLRSPWGIENQLHYDRDATMGEDANRSRSGSATHVLATLQYLAISKLRIDGVTNVAAMLRRNAARVRDLFVNLRILKH